MPKRSSKRSKPDANETAAAITRFIAGEGPKPEEPKAKNPAAVALGRLGGLKGGKARAEKLSAKKRAEIAKKPPTPDGQHGRTNSVRFDPMTEQGQQPADPPMGPFDQATYTSIFDEHNIDRQQRDLRKKLLTELEAPKFNDDKKSATIGHISRDSLATDDIPVFGNLLLKVGEVDTLNLILHSPGGDGTVVETLVSLIRSHCKKFRAIIPTSAKSAATLICLGADEIVMGSASELGPIDAQIPIQVSGVRRYASAQSFIDARDTLLKRHADAVKAGEDTAGILQMIASLDLPFIIECERLMDFGRDVGKKLLVSHMFSRKSNKTTKADDVVQKMSSVELHKVHGRTINGQAAKQQLGLNVKLCGDDEPFWRKVWEWYIRAEILMGRNRATKLFESRDEILLGLAAPPK